MMEADHRRSQVREQPRLSSTRLLALTQAPDDLIQGIFFVAGRSPGDGIRSSVNCSSPLVTSGLRDMVIESDTYGGGRTVE